MATARLDDDTLLQRISLVFRDHGYEGASLARLSAATGLQRASLYHRFPGGKAEMARAVLQRTDAWFGRHVLAPLASDGAPKARVRKMAKALATFYESGERACLLDTLSVGQSDSVVREHIRGSLELWADSMRGLASEAGLPSRLARRRAAEALVRIQGSLVLARGLGDATPFQQALADLPDLLTEA